MLKLTVYVPEAALETVKTAIFTAGAGRVGHYDQCCWQVLGQGQFRPLVGSKPHLGQRDRIESVSEYRVESMLEPHCLDAVVTALLDAHPYETPAYDVVALLKP